MADIRLPVRVRVADGHVSYPETDDILGRWARGEIDAAEGACRSIFGGHALRPARYLALHGRPGDDWER